MLAMSKRAAGLPQAKSHCCSVVPSLSGSPTLVLSGLFGWFGLLEVGFSSFIFLINPSEEGKGCIALPSLPSGWDQMYFWQSTGDFSLFPAPLSPPGGPKGNLGTSSINPNPFFPCLGDSSASTGPSLFGFP